MREGVKNCEDLETKKRGKGRGGLIRGEKGRYGEKNGDMGR
jgi:hypothetical protein